MRWTLALAGCAAEVAEAPPPGPDPAQVSSEEPASPVMAGQRWALAGVPLRWQLQDGCLIERVGLEVA